MATILPGWELGEGLGHIQPLLQVARPLAAEGHRIVLVLCNVAESWPVYHRDAFTVLQAPYWNYRQWPAGKSFLASNLADVLAVRGWEKVDTLLPLLDSWRHLLDYVRPHLIISNFSPTLSLAAYQAIPIVQMGAWFEMAPVHAPTFPALLTGQPPVIAQEDLLKVVQEAQRRRGRPVPPTLTSILATRDRFPATFPELDPYQAVRSEPVWDPFETVPELTPLPHEDRFFAYLTADNPYVEGYLTTMAQTGCPGSVYLRSASAELKARLRLLGLVVHDEPARLADVLLQSTVIIHHGGGTTANSAFAAGRPQILFPQHLEQIITAQVLTRLGVAVFVLGNTVPEVGGRALRQVLGDRRHAEHAQARAQRLRQRPRCPALPAILERCRQHLKAAV